MSIVFCYLYLDWMRLLVVHLSLLYSTHLCTTYLLNPKYGAMRLNKYIFTEAVEGGLKRSLLNQMNPLIFPFYSFNMLNLLL